MGILSLIAFVAPAFLSAVLTSAAPAGNATAFKRDTGFAYGTNPVRGVNAGGWLVLEPWITPNLFSDLDSSIVDEWTFCANQDRGKATAALQAHWDSFMTQQDFYDIANAGLNHVRLPIGFWAFDVSGGEPYIQGQKAYLYKAISWARNAGIKVLIDLHGAPGSQNGYDNSGKRGQALWHTDPNNIARTKAVITSIAQEFSAAQYYGVVTALELLNEPAGYLSSDLLSAARAYSIDNYYNARYPFASSGNGAQSGLAIVYHDAFQDVQYWNGAFSYPATHDVILDNHHYQCFNSYQLGFTWEQHLSAACGRSSQLDASPNWAIVGEWSLAAYDCAVALNGRGLGARYDGSLAGYSAIGSCGPNGNYFSGDASLWSNDYKSFLKKYYVAQVQTWERHGKGWVFWTWKNSYAKDWSYKDLLAMGIIPSQGDFSAYTC